MKVRLNGTLDRTRGYLTPAEPDAQCPFFRKRFFEWGVTKERRACCEMVEGQGFCEYRLVQTDGTPICARYIHGPQYEPDQDTGDVIDDTFALIPHLEDTKLIYQKTDPTTGDPLFLDHTVDPPAETTASSGVDADGNPVTFEPIMIEEYARLQWLTNDYVDTHGKRFRIRNGVLGWYHEV